LKILLTGGAGFIGSHILEALLKSKALQKVRVLDNLSSGSLDNIAPFLEDSRVEFIEGDIRTRQICLAAVKGMEMVSHQAALGSVPRSIREPLNTHDNNVNGFINILYAAKEEGIKKMVYASSSSVYGDAAYQPKVEERIGKPLSPYAVSKQTNELYAEVFSKCYGMRIAGFRYFNVFGTRQNPNGPYAAVIPLFISHALTNSSPMINGDGTITRDFTHVENVVKANLNALSEDAKFEDHEVFNIACGATTTLNDLWDKIKSFTGADALSIKGPNRPGDILHSLADISKAAEMIGYSNLVMLEEGLGKTIPGYVSNTN